MHKMDNNQFREMALSFPGTAEAPHFDRAAFKIEGKRIFATLHEAGETANLRLPLEDQATFCAINPEMISPVRNKYDMQGWTTFNLKNIPPELMLDALNTAYQNALKAKTSKHR